MGRGHRGGRGGSVWVICAIGLGNFPPELKFDKERAVRPAWLEWRAQGRILRMDTDDLICYCFRISRRKIVNYVKRERPPRASMISECFGAGTGCGWCIPYLTRIHREIVGDEVVEGDDISPEDYERLRLEYLEEIREGQRARNQHPAGRRSETLE